MATRTTLALGLALVLAVGATAVGQDTPSAAPDLGTLRVDLSLEAGSFDKAVEFLGQAFKAEPPVRFEVDPALREELPAEEVPPVVLRGGDVSLSDALAAVCIAFHPRASWRRTEQGAVQFYLGPEDLSWNLYEREDLPGGNQEAMSSRLDALNEGGRYDLAIQDAGLQDVAAALAKALELPVHLTSRAREAMAQEHAPRVTVDMKQAKLQDLCETVAGQVEGLDFKMGWGAVFIDMPPPPLPPTPETIQVSIMLIEPEAEFILDFLAHNSGLSFETAPEAAALLEEHPRVPGVFRYVDQPLELVMNHACIAIHPCLGWEFVAPRTVRLVARPEEVPLEQRTDLPGRDPDRDSMVRDLVDGRMVNVTLDGDFVTSVASYFSRVVRAPCVFTAGAGRVIQQRNLRLKSLHIEGKTAAQALDQICAAAPELHWNVAYGAVFIDAKP